MWAWKRLEMLHPRYFFSAFATSLGPKRESKDSQWSGRHLFSCIVSPATVNEQCLLQMHI